MEEKISETILIIEDFYWYYWVKTNHGILTGKLYDNREECLSDAKILDTKENAS